MYTRRPKLGSGILDRQLNNRDWDDAFANMAHIPGSDALPDKWVQDAEAYRASGIRIEEISYGDAEREAFDLIWPDETPKGLAVFVHGGYWMATDKSFWTHFAEGARAQGWAVCMPSYTLAPSAKISDITKQVGAAITKAAQRVAGPIRLSGHSAGGHLAGQMVCSDTPLQNDVADRIEHALSISGLHDLRPLLNTKMNDTLGLDMPEAIAQSAALNHPRVGANMTAWVGGGERPEFIRQSQLLAMMWSGFDIDIALEVDGDYDHFSVLNGLQSTDSPIAQAFVETAL